MSRATMKSKWKTHGSFRTQAKATKKYEELEKCYPEKTFTMIIRKWDDKDKRRFQVKELVREGTKNVNK